MVPPVRTAHLIITPITLTHPVVPPSPLVALGTTSGGFRQPLLGVAKNVSATNTIQASITPQYATIAPTTTRNVSHVVTQPPQSAHNAQLDIILLIMVEQQLVRRRPLFAAGSISGILAHR